MSTFPLDQMDEHLLKQIVKKFTPFSGTAFYGSCRGAKDLIDRLKPLWDLPESRLDYIGNRKITIGNQWLFFPKGGTSANVPLEFCRIENVDVCSCKTDYIKAVILPQIAAVGGVGRLDIAWISDSDVQLLIATTKPETVALWDHHHDPTSPIFEGVKNLDIHVHRNNLESYWRTKKLFELARNRRSITLHLWDSPKQLIASFIENCLKGQKTGTLEQLTVIPNLDLEKRRTLRKKMEDLMKSHIKTDKGYIVERGGDARLRIGVDSRTLKIAFFLS